MSTDDYNMAELARIADDVEAGRIALPPRWGFERPGPGVQVWTAPDGRHYTCDDDGNVLSVTA